MESFPNKIYICHLHLSNQQKMTYSISKDILQSHCGLGYSFRRPLVRSLARNFNRIKVAFQGLGGGEALLNRQIVIFNGALDITEHVRLCLDFSIHFVKFVVAEFPGWVTAPC